MRSTFYIDLFKELILLTQENSTGYELLWSTSTRSLFRAACRKEKKISNNHMTSLSAKKRRGGRGGGGSKKQQQQPKWKSTNRRNTMIGVDYGIGSGRILSSHLSSAMTTMDSQFPSGEEPPSVMNAIEMLQLSKKRAAQDFSRRKRAYLAARYQHQQKLASSVELQHLEGYNSIYGVNRFK